MNCIKCGALLEEGDVFCKNCGTPVQNNNSNAFNYDGNNNQPQQSQQVNYNAQQQVQPNYNVQQQAQPNYNEQQQVQPNYNVQQQAQPNYNIQQQAQPSYNMQQSAQPNYTQMNQNGQTYPNGNDNKGIKIAVIVIISIAIIGSLLFIGYSVIKALNKDNNNDFETIEENDNNKDISQNVDKSSTYKVYYQGFTYYIPDNLVYNLGDELYIGDEEQTWVAGLYAGQGSFQQLKQNKNSISNNLVRQLANSGITAEVSNAEVETIDNIEYITLEVSAGGENGLIVYTQLNSMYFLCISLNNEDNDINKDLLKNLTSIINTAEYDSDSYYLKDDSQVDASKLINIIDE